MHSLLFFFQYGADVSLIDHEGRNALWYARSSRSTESIEILLAAGCIDQKNKTITKLPHGSPGGM